MATASELREELYEIELMIAPHHLLKYLKTDLDILLVGAKDPDSRIGQEVSRKTTEPHYQGTGVIVKIEGDRAQVQWDENKTWYALSKLIPA
ncbi:MAG: hypothetical protein KME35_24270 [Aphanocapsa sp. GSE-SYN-MK-11-07L]|jgi:hypothetical protein|nr:hypothetical protein [Aphanocapsa sp. GSE-SYN-MK-11-07L]